MYIFIAILAFGVLILIHELGHFLAAKASNIRVLEFSLGMGPTLWKRQGKETLYSLRLFPIGGYCAMEGEDESSSDPRAFTNASLPKRLITLAAGSFMNFLLGFVIVLFLMSAAGEFQSPVVTGFMEGCPYEGEYGFQVGDEIYKVNGERTYTPANFLTYVTRTDGDGLVDLVLLREGRKVTLDNYPLVPAVETPRADGTVELKYGFYFTDYETGPLAALKYAWFESLDFVRMVRVGLTDLVTGRAGLTDLTGVVGIVGVISEVGQEAQSKSGANVALQVVLELVAFIAVNLAVVNLLPLPALDGGRVVGLLLTCLIEAVTRRKVNPKVEGYIHYAGLLLLLGLMLVVTFNDIVRLVRGG